MNRVVEPRSFVQSHRSMFFTKSFRATGNVANRLILTAFFFLLFPHGAAAQASEDVPYTGWKDRRFHVDVAGVVRRSDIVLARPNVEAGQAMPLGNGRLGVAQHPSDRAAGIQTRSAPGWREKDNPLRTHPLSTVPPRCQHGSASGAGSFSRSRGGCVSGSSR
jgi:hypothetical protein